MSYCDRNFSSDTFDTKVVKLEIIFESILLQRKLQLCHVCFVDLFKFTQIFDQTDKSMFSCFFYWAETF